MEELNQICTELSGRLETLRVRNHELRSFYPNGTARDFFRMHEETLKQFFQRLLDNLGADVVRDPISDLVRRTLRHFSTILAIVLRIYMPGDITLLRQFAGLLIIHQTPNTPSLNDQNLPIRLPDARFYFPQRANDFFDTQFQFCAITLRMEDVINQDDFRAQCPLPYRRQEIIGGGAFGQVYKVKIECRHLRSLENNTGNDEPLWLARKDFRRHQAFESELDVLTQIMKQPQKHDHLVMVLAILQYGDTNSLFFPLASCDLHQYLNGEIRANEPAPTTLEQKEAIYKRGVALAGALAFLHGGFGGAVCLHLDLKPRNVLVYDAYDGDKEIWKITDFGLTRVRNQEHSSTAPGREGTYLPPECATPTGRVTTQSDVWSFGCIFSLVVTYMLHGSRGVRKFTEKRGERPEGDSFYITTRNSTPRISPAVTYWFDQLRLSTTADSRESKVIQESLDYLQRKTLHPIRGQRASAKDVEIALKRIQTNFNPEPPPASPSSLESPKPHKTFSNKLRSWTKRRSSDLSSRLQNFQYNLGTNGFGFRFSPLEGNFLAFFSPHRILVWTVSEIMSALANRSEIPQPKSLQIPDESIKCFAMSSSSICACLDGDSFKVCYTGPSILQVTEISQCYLYNVEGSSPAVRVDNEVRVSYDHMGFIRKVAMSLDGALVAFVITSKPRGLESDCRIYLAYTQHLMDTADSGGNMWSLPRSSRSNSEVSESSFLSVTTAANLIGEKVKVGSAVQIRFLDFTPDGRFLVIIIQEGTSGFSIRAWETYSGRCYRDFSLTIETSQTLRSLFTTCSLYISRSGDPCLAMLADHRRIIHVNLFTRSNNYRVLSINVDSMFVCDDGQTMVLIGKNNGLRAYLLPVHALDRSEFLGTAKIDEVSYSPALDAAAVKRDENQQLKLLIASESGSFLDMSIQY
ncbi:kinase-like domain-containing protein [Aspergillus granulosus]|uniref:Kinase-like domain-containing protein n=1 Tax=Aspergillus granulosus TaxID=176169 RepID=A0ABR4H198_9EURO